jgi:hypothetical protein
MGWTGARGRALGSLAAMGAAALAAAVLAAGHAGAQPRALAHSLRATPAARPHAAVCPNAYEADYVTGAVHLTFRRTGHYLSPRTGITVDSREVDVVSPAVDHRDHVKLQVETVCHTGEIRFLDETRTGTSQLTRS